MTWILETTLQQLYDHFPPTSKTIQVRWTKHEGYYWRSVGKLARTYLQQLYANTGSSLEDLPGGMDGESGKSMLAMWLDDDDDDSKACELLDHYTYERGCPHGVMVRAMDCGILVREFELQSRYYIHFRANTLGKGMKPLILPAMG